MWWYILLSIVSFCLLLYAIIAICNKLLVWILWYWNHPHPSNDFRREDSIIIMRTIIRCGLLLFFESENSVILLLLLLLLLTNHKKLLTCKWLQHCPSLNHYSTISSTSNTREIAYLSCDELVEWYSKWKKMYYSRYNMMCTMWRFTTIFIACDYFHFAINTMPKCNLDRASTTAILITMIRKYTGHLHLFRAATYNIIYTKWY